MIPNIVEAIETLHQFMEQTGCTTVRMWVGREGGKYDGNRYMISMIKGLDYEEECDDEDDDTEYV